MVLQRGRDCFCCVSVLQQREPHLPIMDDTVVQLRWSELKDGLMKCVICRDIFTQTRTTKEVGCAAPLSRPRRRGARDPLSSPPRPTSATMLGATAQFCRRVDPPPPRRAHLQGCLRRACVHSWGRGNPRPHAQS